MSTTEDLTNLERTLRKKIEHHLIYNFNIPTAVTSERISDVCLNAVLDVHKQYNGDAAGFIEAVKDVFAE